MKIVATILMLVFSVGLFGQINPVFTAQVINSRRDLNGGIQIRLKSNNGFTFDSLQVGDIYAVKSGIGIARFTITGKRTTGYRPGMDGTVTLSPLDGFTGEVPLSTPTASGYVYRELENGLIPLEYLNQDYLNWTLMNENLKTLGGSVDTNGPAIPNGEIAFGNLSGDGVISTYKIRLNQSGGVYINNSTLTTMPDSTETASNGLTVISGNQGIATFLRSAGAPTIVIGTANTIPDASTFLAQLRTKFWYNSTSPTSSGRPIYYGLERYSNYSTKTNLNSCQYFHTFSVNAQGIRNVIIAPNDTTSTKSLLVANYLRLSQGTPTTTAATVKFEVQSDYSDATLVESIKDLANSGLRSLSSNGTAAYLKYGLGNKTSSTLSKTKSDYSAMFATDGTLVENNISNGIYLPTVTKNTVADSVITVYTHLYSRNDTVMSITGKLLVNTTSSGKTSVQLTLPPGFTSDFTDALNDVSGVVTCCETTGGLASATAYARVNTTTDRIEIYWVGDSTTATRQEINYNINLRKK